MQEKTIANNQIETRLAFFPGSVFLCVIAYAGLCEEPITSARQFFLLRVLSAVSIAGVAGMIPGILRIRVRTRNRIVLRAGGALAAFLLVYLLNPPKLSNDELRSKWTAVFDFDTTSITEKSDTRELPTAIPGEDENNAEPELFITSLAILDHLNLDVVKNDFYCKFFQYSGTGDYVTKFQNTLDTIKDDVATKGAKGFVNARVAAESHEIQGSKWHSSIVHICGDLIFTK